MCRRVIRVTPSLIAIRNDAPTAAVSGQWNGIRKARPTAQACPES